jgi:hypothetical protein
MILAANSLSSPDEVVVAVGVPSNAPTRLEGCSHAVRPDALLPYVRPCCHACGASWQPAHSRRGTPAAEHHLQPTFRTIQCTVSRLIAFWCALRAIIVYVLAWQHQHKVAMYYFVTQESAHT